VTRIQINSSKYSHGVCLSIYLYDRCEAVDHWIVKKRRKKEERRKKERRKKRKVGYENELLLG